MVPGDQNLILGGRLVRQEQISAVERLSVVKQRDVLTVRVA